MATENPDRLVLVGDFLDFCGTSKAQLTTRECAQEIAALNVQAIIFIRGNHEGFAWFEFQDAWQATGRPLVSLHGSATVVGPQRSSTDFPA